MLGKQGKPIPCGIGIDRAWTMGEMTPRLLIVERYNSALYSTLGRRFSGDNGVAVMVDQRKARRRRRSSMREMDRRQSDRRRRPQDAGDLRAQGFFWVSREDEARESEQVAAIESLETT